MKQIVIIGGGLIGLSAACECLRRGHRVTVIEHAPERRGASFGNAGLVSPSHFIPLAAPGMVALGLKWMWNPESPFYIKPRLDWDLLMWALRFWKASTHERVELTAPLLRDLLLASREAFIRLTDEGGEFGLVQKGLLMLCKTARTFDHEAHIAEQAHALSIPAEILDARQAAALDPGVSMDIYGAVHYPLDCHLQPERYVAVLERRIRAAGGDLVFGPAIRGWRREGPRIAAAVTTEGEIPGDEFVLCTGAWSPQVVREIGLRLPMQAGKGYSMTLPVPVELPQLSSIFVEARVAATPMGGALRFAGTMEIAGFNEDINRHRIAGILKAVPRYFPKFCPDHFEGIQPWCGLRPCSPDGLPYLGRTQAAENLIIATGHAMMGLSLSPITGEIAAQIAAGEPPRFDLALLSPDRYA